MSNSNKRRVFLTLHHRDELSLSKNRRRLGHASYHWGILITPKRSKGRDCYAYDVTNAVDPDPFTRIERNPDYEWRFRHKDNVDPMISGSLLGRILIGKVPHGISHKEIQAILEEVLVPRKNMRPEENCVTWTRGAIRKLQRTGLVEQFDVKRFMDDALKFANGRLGDPGGTVNIINYTRRPM
ncbi:hypothetical protein BDV06DRAFT_136977 [Aspergillus oleicola]